MDDTRESGTLLPPVRRTRRRDWGRLFARVMCVVFALAGLLPIGVGLLVRTKWARGIATHETRVVLGGLGVDASYDLELKIWPLSVTLQNVRVESTDGKGPLLTSKRVSARPKIFGLLAGKLVIDQIEIERPNLRVVLRDGKIENLKLNLPESKPSAGPTRPPFAVVSTSEAEVDLTVDDFHVVAHEIDADVTTDEDEQGGTAFEIALRLAEAKTSLLRHVAAPPDGSPSVAYDDDTLCRLDGRVRLEGKRVLVRRLAAFGAADLDPKPGTWLGCSLSKEDERYVDLSVGHLSVSLPKQKGEAPALDGHVRARAPIRLINRLPHTPYTEGWAKVDVELRYTPETPIPDMAGRIEARGVRVERFSFARSLATDFTVRRSIVASPYTRVEIAEGVAEVRDLEVQPLAPGIPIKGRLVEVHDANFTTLMRDFHVHPHSHVQWDLKEVKWSGIHGTIVPMGIEGELFARTTNFAVYDLPVENPARSRATGVREAVIRGRLAARPKALEFQNCTVTTPKSVVSGVLVSLGYHEIVHVEVGKAKIDLSDLTPLGNVPVSGQAEASATVTGAFGDPHVEGNASIQNFTLGDIQFGDLTQARASVTGVVLDLREAHARKGKSNYELTTGRLDFGGAANMRFDGEIKSKSLNVRDFFSVFRLDEDPRFDKIDGTLSTSARVHVALGGPEDICKGGFLDVRAVTDGRDLNVLGERFDEGHADFEYRWVDRLAGIEGAEIDVRSLSLTKVKKAGRAPLGSVLGSMSSQRGGQLRGSLVVQGFPLARADLMGKAAGVVEGNVSGVARVEGTLTAFDLRSDLSVTPVRILGMPFGASDVHIHMTQKPSPPGTGKTPCGAPIPAAFNKEVFLKDDSSQGDYTIDGKLFGSQVRLDNVVVSRQKTPLITGKVGFSRFDLAPLSRLVAVPTADDATVAAALGGEISGDLVLERIPTADLSRARARFSPTELRVTRGGQKIELRPQAGVITLADDTLKIPRVTFDLAAQSGLKGAFSASGAVKHVTEGPRLALDAELYPVDLGILVGIVPRVTRAVGTLSGSVKITGRPSEPEFDGHMKLRGGELGWKGMPGALTDLDVELSADENEARVTRATGHFMGGDVAMTGRLPLKGGNLGVLTAFVTGRQLSIAPADGVKATVDADLEVTMNPNASTPVGRLPFVGGEVTLTSFEYSRPITVDLTGFSGSARRTVVDTYDPSLDSVTLGFDVRARAPLRIRNNLVDAQLAIDPRGLHVSGTNQRFGLRGELNTISGGRFRVFANDFEVQKGTIRFEDPTRIAPHVDVIAVTEYRRYSNTVASGGAGGGTANTTGGAGVTTGNISSGGRGGGLWRIALHAYGDTEDLRVDMTSDPTLSREDIFFLLTIGLTRAEVDQVRAGSVYASAAFEAIGTVSGADRAVKTAIPVIDDFRFGSGYSARTGRTEPQVTLGRRLTDNVRANVTTGLTEDRQLRSNVEWRLSRPLSIQTSYDNISTVSSGSVGNFGLDFRWRLEFD